AQIYPDTPRVTVNSVHHQGIKTLARDFVVEARCPDDQVIEAVRWLGASFVAAVQWHPEFHRPAEQGVIDDAPILKDFLDAARAARVAA
ncbi:MAG TPA: gamma-glutamyl-gamma-aminobutyrate hydrolase family protein, partial [Burkholderiaceae bacterium]